LYKIIRKIINFYFIFLFLSNAEAFSTYEIAKSNRIGKSYAFEIKEQIHSYQDFTSAFLCKQVILNDIKGIDNRYFHSEYLIKHYDENFTLRTFKSCVINLNIMRKMKR
jgi:hypothetical protein